MSVKRSSRSAVKADNEDEDRKPEVGIALSRRGTPGRVRKRNRLLFDNDSIEVDFPAKRKRLASSPTSKTVAGKKTLSKRRFANLTTAEEKVLRTSKSAEGNVKPRPDIASKPALRSSKDESRKNEAHDEMDSCLHTSKSPPLAPFTPDSSSGSDEESLTPSVNIGYNPLRALLPPASRAFQIVTPPKSKPGCSSKPQENNQKRRKRKIRATSTPSRVATEFTQVDQLRIDPSDPGPSVPSTETPSSACKRRKRKTKKTPDVAESEEAMKHAVAAEAEAIRQNVTQVSKRLRNFLKLPKAHRWISYEFFYSHIDKPIFLLENDFLSCLKELYPKLKSLKLTRMEWNFIRRSFGKPRRCSQAFLNEERRTLEQKREKIRQLQARECFPDIGSEYVPDVIPLPLSIGMRVTARLSKPVSGLFDGIIQAVDVRNHSYRINFNRPDVGLRNVEDFNVAPSAAEEELLIPANQYLGKIRRPTVAPSCGITGITPGKTPSAFGIDDHSRSSSPIVGSADPCLAASDVPLKARLLEGNISAFPLQSLVNIVRVKKLLDTKRTKLEQLKELNGLAEVVRAQDKDYDLFFQRKYASVVLDLENLNADLNVVLRDVNSYCREVAPNEFPRSFTLLKDITMNQAEALVSSFNVTSESHGPGNSSTCSLLQDQPALKLITRILALFMQIKTFADCGEEWNVYDLRALTDTLKEAKASLRPENRAFFESTVEVQVRQVLAAMTISRQATSGLEHCSQPLVDIVTPQPT